MLAQGKRNFAGGSRPQEPFSPCVSQSSLFSTSGGWPPPVPPGNLSVITKHLPSPGCLSAPGADLVSCWARLVGSPCHKPLRHIPRCLYFVGEQKGGMGSLSKWGGAGLRLEPRQVCFIPKPVLLPHGWEITSDPCLHTDRFVCWCFHSVLGFSVPAELSEPSPSWPQKTTSVTQWISPSPEVVTP